MTLRPNLRCRPCIIGSNYLHSHLHRHKITGRDPTAEVGSCGQEASINHHGPDLHDLPQFAY